MKQKTHTAPANGSAANTALDAKLAELCCQYSFELQYREALSLPESGTEGAQAIALRHRCGAELYIVACQSEESAFSYCFATPPGDDKGLPHIVEHAVFCGSKNYPLKEPFANLQKTSVCNFLNAMTYPDQTLYPAASAFAPDFLQLLQVYGDAVFFPLFEHQALAQEGFRQTPDGLDGIVFNEMQGYYGDFEVFVADFSLRSLFPRNSSHVTDSDSYSHPNAFDAGGDPQAIATIDCRDYAEVRSFHRRYYQPQNCRIVMYGSIVEQKLDAILHYLDRQLFAQSADQFTGSSDPASDGLTADQLCHSLILPAAHYPREQVLRQPVLAKPSASKTRQSDSEFQRSIMFSWLLPPQCGARQNIEYRVLAEMLLGHSGAVLELPIMQSGWGADISMGSGLELDLLQPVLRVGLSAYQAKQPEDFRRLIFRALHDFCEQAQIQTEAQTEMQAGQADSDLQQLWQLWHGALNSLEYEECSLGEHGGEDGIYALERCLQLARASHFYRIQTDSNADNSGSDLDCPLTDSKQRVFAALQPFGHIAEIRAAGLPRFVRKIRRWTIDNPHWVLQLFEETPAQPGQLEISVPEELRLNAQQLAQDQIAFSQYQQRSDSAEHVARIAGMQRSEFGRLQDLPECQTRFLSISPDSNAQDNHRVQLVSRRKGSPDSLVQLDLFWEISTWNETQLLLLPSFLDLLEDLGLPGTDYAAVAKQKSLYIGSWNSSVVQQSAFRAAEAGESAELRQDLPMRKFVHFQLNFLPQEWRNGLNLFWQLLCQADWNDSQRLRELLQSLYYDKAQALCSNPQSYASRRAAFRLSQLSQLHQANQASYTKQTKEQNSATTSVFNPLLSPGSAQLAGDAEWLYGLGQVELLGQIHREIGSDKSDAQDQTHDQILAHFASICKKLAQDLLHMPLSCAIAAPGDIIPELSGELQRLYHLALQSDSNSQAEAEFPEQPKQVWQQWQEKAQAVHRQGVGAADIQKVELWQGNLALENLCLALPAPTWGYRGKAELHPALYLLAKLLQNGPAWEKVRLQQGAYGVRVRLSNGFFQLSSSQDPNALNSISLFYQAVAEIGEKALQAAKSHLSESQSKPQAEFQAEFEAAVVQTLAEKLKKPPLGEHARIVLYRSQTGLTTQDLQAWLDRLRQITLEDLYAAAHWLLQHWQQKGVTIFAAAKRVEQQNARFPAALQHQLSSQALPKYRASQNN